MHAKAAICSALLASLAGCGVSESALSSDDVLKAVRSAVTNGRVLAASATSCIPGKTGDRDVQACEVCVATLSMKRLPTGEAKELRLEQKTVAISFARAVSYRQPDVEPSGNDGVWVAKNNISLPDFSPIAGGWPVEWTGWPDLAKKYGYGFMARPGSLGFGPPVIILSRNGITVNPATFIDSILEKPQPFIDEMGARAEDYCIKPS